MYSLISSLNIGSRFVKSNFAEGFIKDNDVYSFIDGFAKGFVKGFGASLHSFFGGFAGSRRASFSGLFENFVFGLAPVKGRIRTQSESQ